MFTDITTLLLLLCVPAYSRKIVSVKPAYTRYKASTTYSHHNRAFCGPHQQLLASFYNSLFILLDLLLSSLSSFFSLQSHLAIFLLSFFLSLSPLPYSQVSSKGLSHTQFSLFPPLFPFFFFLLTPGFTPSSIFHHGFLPFSIHTTILTHLIKMCTFCPNVSQYPHTFPRETMSSKFALLVSIIIVLSNDFVSL